MQKLVNHVKVQHGSDTLFCDSAFFYQDKNSMEAFGDARIMQADGTIAFADYMRYTGNNKTAYMRGNASVSSGEDNLWSEEMEYNLSTKIGKYRKGGTLQTATTIITSEEADYNTRTKDARFKKDVVVQDVDYNATSTDMGYNTNTGIVVFYGPSEVVNEQSTLHTSGGTYDSKNKIAHFNERPNIQDSAYYIEADFIDYNKATGFAKSRGNVIAIDTANKRTLYSDYAQYNELTEDFIAYGKPIAKMLRDKDSFYIRGEIFLAGLESTLRTKDTLSAQDSLQQTLDELNRAAQRGELADSSILNNTDSTDNMQQDDSLMMDTDSASNYYDTLLQTEQESYQTINQNDTLVISKKENDTALKANNPTSINKEIIPDINPPSLQEDMGELAPPVASPPDTSKPRYFIAFHHVLIYSDSLQGRCDSLSYFQSDSLLRMFYQPVLWSGSRQISGDTILSKMDSSSIKQVYVPRNGIMVSRSGPVKADMFDQIQGNKMWAYFNNNNIDSVVAMPNAATIYFATDEDSAYVGASEVTAEKVKITFDTTADGQEIRKIRYDKNISSTMTPMKDVVPSLLRLSRFKWQEERRPKTLDDFMKEDYSASLQDSSLIKLINEFGKDTALATDSAVDNNSKTDSVYSKKEKEGPSPNLPKENSMKESSPVEDHKSDDDVPPFPELLKRKQEEKRLKDSADIK